jgi:hypothetical protein
MKPRALTLLTLLLLPLAASAQRTTLIGIFESTSSSKADGQRESKGDSIGEGKDNGESKANNQGQPGVRVLFYQSGQQWRSYKAVCHDEPCLKTITHLFPSTTAWTLVQSGKPIAKVTAETPAAFHFYSEIGVQAITNPSSVASLEPHPTPGQPDPAHTILATTLPTLTDPDGWHLSPAPSLDLAHAREAFRKLFPHPKNCTQTTTNSPAKYHSATYKDTDIQLDTALLSNKNWRVLQLTLSGYLCDGPPDAAYLDQWFAISPTGEVRHLGHAMSFAGAADFAHNGHSALLFSNHQDNDSGYTLFYDNFIQHTQTTVTHH